VRGRVLRAAAGVRRTGDRARGRATGGVDSRARLRYRPDPAAAGGARAPGDRGGRLPRDARPQPRSAKFQQNAPGSFETYERAERVRDDPGGIRRIIRSARWDAPRLRIEVEYQVNGSTWTHAWTNYQISDEELAANLAAAGLSLGDWLTSDHAWFTAHPV
jgi:hypothetical protein